MSECQRDPCVCEIVGRTDCIHEPTPEMVDAALNAWFKSPPSETDQGLERSMKAALVAANLMRVPAQPVAWKPITMQDVRLMAGEGKLFPADVLNAVNVILKQRAPQPPAAPVDLTNHHNALKCPYCNPKGLPFAETHEGCSAESTSEEDIAIALFVARHYGLKNIMPWDDIEHDGRDYWRTLAKNLMRTHRVAPVSSPSAETAKPAGCNPCSYPECGCQYSPTPAATGDVEPRLKALRQQVVDCIDAGAMRERVVGISQAALEDWFDDLEAISGLIRSEPQRSAVTVETGNESPPRDWFKDLNERVSKGLRAPLEPANNPALNALLAYQQADQDGVMVLTSRQAIHEVVSLVASLRHVLEMVWDANQSDPHIPSPALASIRDALDGVAHVQPQGAQLQEALEEIRALAAGDLSASTSAILAIRHVLATTLTRPEQP